MNSYLGFMWWDEETDGEHMYPKHQKYPTAEEFVQAAMNNPDEASARGLWSDPKFLDQVYELNPQLKHTQFADFHGHGWVYRAVYKKDRKGNFLDYKGDIVPEVTNKGLMAAVKMPELLKEQYRTPDPKASAAKSDSAKPEAAKKSACKDPQRDGVPVHLLDIHLEKGMHCADCHFVQDVHGNTKLYGEVRAAIEIQCIDCHGTITKEANSAHQRPGGAGRRPRLEDLAHPVR